VDRKPARRVAARVALTLVETAVAAAWFFAPCSIAAVTFATLLEAEQAETSLLTLSSSWRQKLKLPVQAFFAAVCDDSVSLRLQSFSMPDMFASNSDSQMTQAAAPVALIALSVSFTNPSMVALQASMKVMLTAGILSSWQLLLMLVLQVSRLL